MKNQFNNVLKGLLFIVAISISTLACSQPPQGGGGPGGRPGGQGGESNRGPQIPNEKQITKMVKKLAKEINLAEDQEEQVLVVYKLHFENVKDLIEKNDRPERSEMEALDVNFQKQVKLLLTEKQQDEYEVYVAKNRENRERPDR